MHSSDRSASPGPQRIGEANIAGEPEIVADYGDRVISLTAAFGREVIGSSSVELIERWEAVRRRLTAPGFPGSTPALDVQTLTWRPPIMPRKLICVGANYADHVEEMARAGAAPSVQTTFPFSFLKPPSTALVGNGRPVALPSYGQKLDWEAELAVVIGAPQLAATDPLRAVFGYTVLNELSLRDFVAPFPHPLGLDAVISKGFDGSAPIGPWITLAEHVSDPQDLRVELRVNGEIKQSSSTAQMIFSVSELVSYYARVLTLEVGDVLATGTPAGVGAGKQPPEYLRAGDEVEVDIEGLCTLHTPIVDRLALRSLDIH